MDPVTWEAACHRHATLTGGIPLLFGLTERIARYIEAVDGKKRSAIEDAIQMLVDRRIERWWQVGRNEKTLPFAKSTARAYGTPLLFSQDTSGNITVIIEYDACTIRPESATFRSILPETILTGVTKGNLGSLISEPSGIFNPERRIISHHAQFGRSSYLRTSVENEVPRTYADIIGDPKKRFIPDRELAITA